MNSNNGNSWKLRDSLNKFRDGELSVKELADMHPDCECENASSDIGSKGKVLDHEFIRLFLSTRNFKVKNIADLEEVRFRELFKENSLSKVFRTGISVCRICHGYASCEEIIMSAEIVYQNLIKDKESGGLFGHLDISVGTIRNAFEDSCKFCVYETPSGPIGSGEYSRPSHADIVWSKNICLYPELYKESKTEFYKLLKYQGTIIFWDDLENCEYSKFLPKKIKEQLSARQVS